MQHRRPAVRRDLDGAASRLGEARRSRSLAARGRPSAARPPVRRRRLRHDDLERRYPRTGRPLAMARIVCDLGEVLRQRRRGCLLHLHPERRHGERRHDDAAETTSARLGWRSTGAEQSTADPATTDPAVEPPQQRHARPVDPATELGQQRGQHRERAQHGDGDHEDRAGGQRGERRVRRRRTGRPSTTMTAQPGHDDRVARRRRGDLDGVDGAVALARAPRARA